jgi:hypothetical protein
MSWNSNGANLKFNINQLLCKKCTHKISDELHCQVVIATKNRIPFRMRSTMPEVRDESSSEGKIENMMK